MRLAFLILTTVLLMVPSSMVTAGPEGDVTGSRADPAGTRAGPMLVGIDSLSTLVEVPPQETVVLRVDHENASLVPMEWNDPLESLSELHGRAVDRVEPWLKRDLAVQLNRMGGNGNRYANLIIDCAEGRWVDEIAFTVANTPPEVLNQVPNVNVLKDNARQLYEQDADIQYADIVERTGEDGNYSTVSYLNYTGVRHEYPRDIYYTYLAHARVFWEDPARVAGKSFWRKAYWDEIEYNTSGTLKSWLTGATNIIEAANASTIWMQMNMEFGYGTNPLQPVQVILERYGSCGQYSITTASSLKVAMIPARVAIYPASDHQWCEVFIDGHWMHVDASNDVAGAATVKEPHLIRRTNSVNFNDAGVFERGWKPYMSAMSTFRSDDVIINSIDISAPDPSFSFRESGMVERTGAEPHIYTRTSTVTINVEDSGGDPIEGAWVGVFRVGHDIYNPGTPDYPHFAYANYTNATGKAEFELGLQGYCGRCDDDHYYAALILSRYNQGTNDFYAFSVPEEDQEYSHTYTVAGNAPSQVEPTWFKKIIIGTDPPAPEFKLNVSLEAWGRQRHTHGEYGQYEMFGFRTSFDHLFPSDVDVLVVDGEGLQDYLDGNRVGAWLGATDAEMFEGGEQVPHDEATYLLLSNTDSHYTTKVVNLTVELSAMCYPKLRMDNPVSGTDHSTAVPLVFSGTLWDYIPVTGLDVSFDRGDTWVDIYHGYDPANRTFEAEVNVSHLPSGDRELVLRATNDMGVVNLSFPTIFFDADDPVIWILEPSAGTVRSGLDPTIDVSVNATDNRAVTKVEARWENGPWHTMEGWEHDGTTHMLVLPIDGRFGSVVLEVRVTDGVGRTAVRSVEQVFDVIMPTLELIEPEAGDVFVVGSGWNVTVRGAVWDDHGIHSLRYAMEYGAWTDVTEHIGDDDVFNFVLPTTGLEEGEHTVTVTVTDLALHTENKTFTLVIDATAPDLAIEELDPYYDDGDDVELAGTVTDDYDVEGLWVTIDDEDEAGVYLDITGGFKVRLPSGSDEVGEHQVVVRAVDVHGNEVKLVLDYQVLDETDPALAIENPTMGANIGRGNPIHLTGTSSDNVAITVMAVKVGVEDTMYILDNLDPALWRWSIDIGTAGKALGQLILEVRVEDAAGNMAVGSVIVNIVDRTDPTLEVTVDPLTLPKVQKGKVMVVPAQFSDDVAVTRVEYRLDGWSWVTVPCQYPCEAWDLEVPTGDLSVGGHVLEVRVTDAAGNDEMVSIPFEVKPVPESSTISTGTIAGVVVAVVTVLLLAYLLVLRKGPVTEGAVEDSDGVETGPVDELGDGDDIDPEPEPGDVEPVEDDEGQSR